MVEICDTYTKDGKRTGKTVVRGTIMPADEYYLVVHVWIRNKSGAYMIQQRAPQQRYPGLWATTAGVVQSGEDSITGAIRETQEEMGINLLPQQLTLFERLVTKYQIEDIWFAEYEDEPTIGEEVSDWRWASKADIQRMVEAGEFFPYNYIDRLPE